MKILFQILLVLLIIVPFELLGQKFYLGNYLEPTPNEFELIGISSKTSVSTYKFKNEIYDTFFNRKIGDIIIGIRDGIIVTTVYNLIPNQNDIGVPNEILRQVQENLPFPLAEINGGYGVNIDNESISIARTNNSITFYKDRIMFINTVKQSILERTKK